MEMSKDDKIYGLCLDMCPKDERDLREREGLLHRLEMCSAEINLKGKRYKADAARTVKCFSRPAAGVISPGPNILRPGPVLIETVRFLLTEIVSSEHDHTVDVYEFVTDRLRAVRQDMIIQRLDPEVCLQIIEPMIRFHVLFGYILCKNKKFELHLNGIYLQECILKAFECYTLVHEIISNDKNTVESIYTCLNIKNPEIVLKHISNYDGTNFELVKAIVTKNYVRFFQLSLSLDALSKAALAINVPQIRLCAGLFSLCQAFSSKNASYPIQRIGEIFSYNSVDDVLSDFNQLGIRYDNAFCFFNKKDLLPLPEFVAPQHWWCVENDIKSLDLTKLLLKL